jgi:hypothetical protein
VKNTGEVKLYCVNVTDDLLPGGYWYIGELAVGESKSKEVRDPSTPVGCVGEIEFISNEASVTAKCCADGNNEDCCVVSDSVVATVKVKPIFSLDVMVKVMEPKNGCCYEPGEVVTMGVGVMNTGKYPVNGFELFDELKGVHIVVTTALAPGQHWGPQIFTYTIPSDWTYCDDGKYLEDCWWVTACVLCPDTGANQITDRECISLEVCGPQLLMTKEAYVNGELVTEVWPGDVVTYEITVKNVGEHSVSCIYILDTVMIGCMPVYFQSDMICCLAPCTEYVWTFEYTVPEWFCEWGDNLCDKAVAFGLVNDIECCFEMQKRMDCGYNPWMEMACAENCLFVHNEFHLEVIKMNNFGYRPAAPGDVIYYEIWVINAGTCSVTNVYVDDDMIGLHEKIDCLMPCRECYDNVRQILPCNIAVFRGSYQIPSDWSYCDDGSVITNTVTVKGWQCGVSQTVSDTNYVYVFDPCDIRISVDYPLTAKSGETVTVTVTVSNEGSGMACGLRICDDRLGLDEMIWCLAPCDSVTFTRQVVIPACDGITHYVSGSTGLVGCCCECWKHPALPNGVLELSQIPRCCCVEEHAEWSIMIQCGCCGDVPVVT